MEKPAPVDYPIHDLLRRRWSPRAFAPDPVEPEKLRSLFEAARWAPSSFNEQPWAFLVATREEPDGFRRLLDCLIESNAVWAQHAPVLALSVARRHFERDGRENRHAFHDVGQAVAHLTVQATHFGLFVHQMAGFDVERARTELGLPEGWDPVAMIALGYPGDPNTLPERLRQRELAPRVRKPQREFVFGPGWGRIAPFAERSG